MKNAGDRPTTRTLTPDPSGSPDSPKDEPKPPGGAVSGALEAHAHEVQLEGAWIGTGQDAARVEKPDG